MLAVSIREVQKTLAQSSKRLIEDKIAALGVGARFRVFSDRIETPGGGLIIFRGMQDSADVAISGQTAGLPTGYLQARRFYLNSDPIQELGYIVPDLFWRTYISVCAGRPTRFTVEGENFVFGPTPDD